MTIALLIDIYELNRIFVDLENLTSHLNPGKALQDLCKFQMDSQLHLLEPIGLLLDHLPELMDTFPLTFPSQLLFHIQPFDAMPRILI